MQTNIINSMKREMKRRMLSPRTIDSYLFYIDKFLSKFNKNPRKINKKEIKNYLDDLAEKGKAGSTINIHLCAVRFLMEEVLHRNIYLNLRYSKRPKTLPVFMTKDETKRFFSVIENQKHKLMLELMYSAGLRVSELLNLKVRDIEANHGWVRHGKGNKDRVFIIADKLKEYIGDHIKNNNLNDTVYLFVGRNGKMHPSTIRKIVKNNAQKAKIKKNVHPHTLRHSFGTHMAENGCNIVELQSLLGHSRIDTTMIYIHSAFFKLFSAKSPFDSL